MGKSENEWDQRVLCSDGNCIGIIGADGRCKVCGMPYDGELASPVTDAHTADEDADGSPAEQPMTEADARIDDDPADESDGSDDSWNNRTLCADESCIGVIGPDGRCKECGKPYIG
ncbi:hypothetical protein [uncultured Desulfosarcina sp.]|uniref:hypothetical protein n=1 Tax=uncultured Desulfosarcina sp. TaxID=218289 RepID=UPI0029C8FC78|nr:hypothetical protein [uncultured Desulfosarcina sp.]